MKRIKPILYFIYNFSGIRHLWENIICPIDKETKKWKPSTFIIWLIGLYVALFGIASQRYENRADIVEIRINSVFRQLSTPQYKRGFSRIAETQSLSCPLKPDIKNPITVYQSLFKDTVYLEGVELLKETVEHWKDSLNNVDLSGAYLRSANLMDANLRRADLEGADLQDAILWGAYFEEANLMDANLRRANSRNADLSRADLRRADLEGANLMDANLSRAYLDSANFEGARNLRKNQLSISLYILYPPINLPEGIEPPPQQDINLLFAF